MTTRIRFDGPGHLLKLREDLILGLGSEADVDDDQAQLLLESPEIYGVVTVIKPPKPEPAAKAPEPKEK